MIAQSDIVEVAQRVLKEMVGLELDPVQESEFEDEVVSGCALITGAWDGAIVLECSILLASQIAGAMFSLDTDQVTTDEVQDALDEVVNIISGNLRALLPSPSNNLPSTQLEAQPYLTLASGISVEQKAALSCDGEQALVKLLKHS